MIEQPQLEEFEAKLRSNKEQWERYVKEVKSILAGKQSNHKFANLKASMLKDIQRKLTQ